MCMAIVWILLHHLYFLHFQDSWTVTHWHPSLLVMMLKQGWTHLLLQNWTENGTIKQSTLKPISNHTKRDKCIMCWDSLKKSYHNWNSKTEWMHPSERTSTTSMTNFSLLTSTEQLQCYKQLVVRYEKTVAKRKLTMKEHSDKRSDRFLYSKSEMSGLMKE